MKKKRRKPFFFFFFRHRAQRNTKGFFRPKQRIYWEEETVGMGWYIPVNIGKDQGQSIQTQYSRYLHIEISEIMIYQGRSGLFKILDGVGQHLVKSRIWISLSFTNMGLFGPNFWWYLVNRIRFFIFWDYLLPFFFFFQKNYFHIAILAVPCVGNNLKCINNAVS